MNAEQLCREDAAARALARTLFDVPLALEAGAGTGKTAALVARVATWVLTGGWERARAALGDGAGADHIAARALERVAMVTFTEKAAVEMEQRIARALRALAGDGAVVGLPVVELGLDDGERRARAAALTSALDRLAVRTIHAFSSALLARHALAAGLHPAFVVDADGALVRAACAEVVADALPRALGERPDPAWLALLELGPGPQEVLEALRTLVGARVTPEELARDPYPDQRVGELVHGVALRAGQVAELLFEALPDAPNRNLAKAAQLAEALGDLALPLAGVRSADALPRDLVLDPDEVKRLRAFEADEFTASERKALGDAALEVQRLCAGLADDLALVAAIDAPLARAARAVLAPLLGEVGERLRARGVLTFEDLLVRARDLLRDSAPVRRAVRREIDQLLVDEFQDTDRVQCELVRWLALDGPRDERPGLFLVGDPKQSIYGWRSADLEAYEAMLQALEGEGGRRARLSINYRSSQRVLDEVEALVAPSMRAVPGLQPAFEPVLEGRSGSEPPTALFADGRAPVEHWSADALPG
ncbi:MAG TPA: UvrD-helicase domain-containing protein, partial [Planctomycetota bacterium]|nr:UvrD-helicase domain-containing protein [Planctomycetota bacterium]